MTKSVLVSLVGKILACGESPPLVEDLEAFTTKELSEALVANVELLVGHYKVKADAVVALEKRLEVARGVYTQNQETIKELQVKVAEQQAELQKWEESYEVVDDTTDEQGMPKATKKEVVTDTDPLTNFCGERRMNITPKNSLWWEMEIRQQGDRFILWFPQGFYNQNRSDCYQFLGMLKREANKRSFQADFEQGALVVIARRNSYKLPEPDIKP